MFGNCNHCCFCCGHPCTMLGVSLLISCKNKIQCVCTEKKKKETSLGGSSSHLPQQTSTIPFHPASHLFMSFNQQLFVEYLLCASSKNVPRSWEELKTVVLDFNLIEKHNVTMFSKTRETRPSIRTINVNVFSSPMKPEDFQIQQTRISRAS